MKDSVKSVTVLFTICLIVSALLAAVYFVTGPIIEASEKAKSDAALLVVMPKGSGFKKIDDLSGYSLPETVTDVYSEENGGYVFKLRVTGYAPNFIIMCGVGASGEITGATCISSSETLGAEKVYGDYFIGADIGTVENVDAVSGSTAKLTMNAYKTAIKNALEAFDIINGKEKISLSFTEGGSLI